jgi:heme/copper-type cytochrome/quinol oxidase subunit 2
MNIAFTTILIVIILAPGFLAKNAYSASKLSVRDPNRNIVNELVWSIIPALIIHTVFIFLIESFSDYYIDFKQLGNLILGISTANKAEDEFYQLSVYKYEIFAYNVFVDLTSFCIGFLARKVVRETKLDRRRRVFRFSNKWHYIFTGECLDFPDVPDDFEEISTKIINVLCKVNGKTVLYTGEYFNYYIDSKGDLEAVHLKYPIRRYFEHDEQRNYYSISSRYLVIPNSDIININFRYLNLIEVDESDLTEEELKSIIEE